MVFLYGRAGRLTAENGGFRPGQVAGAVAAQRERLGLGAEQIHYGPAGPGRSPHLVRACHLLAPSVVNLSLSRGLQRAPELLSGGWRRLAACRAEIPRAITRLAATLASADVPWSEQGSVELPLCTTAQPPHTRFTNIFGASLSEAAMRPDPRSESGLYHVPDAALAAAAAGLLALLCDAASSPDRATSALAIEGLTGLQVRKTPSWP